MRGRDVFLGISHAIAYCTDAACALSAIAELLVCLGMKTAMNSFRVLCLVALLSLSSSFSFKVHNYTIRNYLQMNCCYYCLTCPQKHKHKHP